jgi:hypothetical protein
MGSKTNLEMMEMFNLIVKQGMTPNQFYLLYCIRESVGSLHINMHQELRTLYEDGWLTPEAGTGKPMLVPKAHSLLQQVESFFHVQKKKTSNQVMGKDYGDKIAEYLLLFPKIKLPSGKAARTDKRNCETAFKWFFENHEYSWEIILKATALYVDEFEKKNYLYMQTSQYFIRKQQADKTWGSEMANWCSAVESGDMSQTENHFSEKVV